MKGTFGLPFTKELKAGDKIQYQYNGGNPLPSLDDITIS